MLMRGFILSVLMLVLLYVPERGLMKGGARGWLRLGPIIAEPSELVKFAVVFFLAVLLSKRQDRIREFKRGRLAALFIFVQLSFMILKRPALGSTVEIGVFIAYELCR